MGCGVIMLGVGGLGHVRSSTIWYPCLMTYSVLIGTSYCTVHLLRRVFCIQFSSKSSK